MTDLFGMSIVELAETIKDNYEWTIALSKLLGIELEESQWICFTGEKLGVMTIQQAIQQQIVRSHELVRVRQNIQASNLSETQKAKLVNILNLMTSLINELIKLGPTVEAMERGDMLIQTIQSLFPIREEPDDGDSTFDSDTN